MEFKSCPLTGWKLDENFTFEETDEVNPQIIKDYTLFKVVNEVKSFLYLIKTDLIKNPVALVNNQHTFKWILINNLFHHNLLGISKKLFYTTPCDFGIDEKQYQDYIENYSNISPKEKLDHFLITIYCLCDGSFIIRERTENVLNRTAFQSREELKLYLEALGNNDFIIYQFSPDDKIFIQLKFQGILEVAKLKESGKNSKRCFVAMSFDSSLKETREAIRNGVKEAGYNAVFIDEVNPVSDQTINDAIIAEIKKSKFLVADFTQQKNGVYFEAGYALGRGLKVIYCCEEKDFAKSHFDLKPFSHILYSSTEELQKRLKYKIEAWIE
jgi:hypothetical protein